MQPEPPLGWGACGMARYVERGMGKVAGALICGENERGDTINRNVTVIAANRMLIMGSARYSSELSERPYQCDHGIRLPFLRASTTTAAIRRSTYTGRVS